MMDVTIAICTYKRLEPLRVTLESLAKCVALAEGDLTCEVLVVDNDPAGDGSVEKMVESFREKLPGLRYEVEKQTGTSFARNHAVEAARGAVVLFTDDDVTFAPDWLRRMTWALKNHPECDFWGGRVEPVADPGVEFPPRWFNERLCPMLGDTIVQYRPGGDGQRGRYWEPTEDHPFYTANLGLRVEAVRQAGMFNTQVGHRGKVRMGMEDSLMVRAISAQGGRGWYAAEAVVYHPIPAERLTKKYARSFAWRQGWLAVHMLRLETPGGRTPAWLYRLALERALRGLGQWLGGMLTGQPDAAFAGLMEWVFNSSKFWHGLRQERP